MDENDASQVIRTISPLHRWTEIGAAVLLSHHPKKGDAAEGQAARGSGALAAFVDVIIEMRRYNAADRKDTRRVLTTYSRYEQSPPEVVVDFKENHYAVVGTKGEANQGDRLRVTKAMLPTALPGRTIEELLEAWPSGSSIPKPGDRTLAGDLSEAFDAGQVQRSGEGKKGDPYRFWVKDSIPASGPSIVPESDGGGLPP